MSFLRGYARKLGVMEYLGAWNAATNTPTLTSSAGQRGGYYVVSQAGTTELNGISDWGVKDWVIFNGTIWEKIDNSEASQIVNSLSGSETDKAPSVLSVKNNFVDKSFGFLHEVHVAKNGNDAGSSGKPYQPFLTLSAAVSYVEANFTNNDFVVIYIHPGAYLESVIINRPRTHLIGVQSTNAIISQIGSVTFNPTTVVGGVYNSSFSMENVLVGASNAAALTVAGTAECSLHLRNVYLYANGAGQKGITVTNAAATKSRFYFNDLLINNLASNAAGIELLNCVAQIKNTTVYTGNGPCLSVGTTASAIAGFCQFETTGGLAVDLGATTLTLATSSVAATSTDASGVSVAAGGTYTSVQNFYNVGLGTGYAITGSTGGVVTHAANLFAFNTNNKYKNVLYTVAHSTTMTASG